jgi:hypothetical protein
MNETTIRSYGNKSKYIVDKKRRTGVIYKVCK